MLVYNDQSKHINKQDFDDYKIVLPRDDFWSKINTLLDFQKILKMIIKDNSYNLNDEYIKYLKISMYQTYYSLTDNKVLNCLKYDIDLKSFLEIDITENISIDQEKFVEFKKNSFDRIKVYKKIIEYISDITKNKISYDIEENNTPFIKSEIRKNILILFNNINPDIRKEINIDYDNIDKTMINIIKENISDDKHNIEIIEYIDELYNKYFINTQKNEKNNIISILDISILLINVMTDEFKNR